MNVDSLFGDISSFAKGELGKFGDEIEDVISSFYEKSKTDIKEYTQAFADCIIPKEEYESLLRQKAQLLEAAMLTEAVRRQVQLKEFQDEVIGFIIDKVFDALL